MAGNDAWRMIHAERRALATELEPLSDEQWATPSLCAGWSVRDVLAHLTSAAMMTPMRFIGHLASSGFRFNAMSDRDIAAVRGATPADTLAAFRAHLDDTTAPPGPIDAMVGEAVLHGEDIRRPLGIAHAYAPETLVRVVDFYRKSNLLIGAKRRCTGLTLRATDVGWSAGSGPEVQGPLLSIILAVTGRRAGLADLSGEGVATLGTRV